jgi:hypothetical protein
MRQEKGGYIFSGEGDNAMDVEWVSSPSQTLDELYAKDRSHSFLHNGVLYTGIMRLIIAPEDTLYVVIASGTTMPTELLGSTIVTPVTLVPPNTLRSIYSSL